MRFPEELRRGGGFFLRGGNGTPPQVERLRFFSAGAQRGGFCVGVAAGFAQAKKSAERLIFFFVVYFFIMPQKALGYTPLSKV